jgi:hypothetical protein
MLPPPPAIVTVTEDAAGSARFVGGALPWLAIGRDGEPIMQGQEGCRGYRPKHFKTRDAAERAAAGLKPKRPRKARKAG